MFNAVKLLLKFLKTLFCTLHDIFKHIFGVEFSQFSNVKFATVLLIIIFLQEIKIPSAEKAY